METTREECEANGGTWMTDEGGVEMCKHDQAPATEQAAPSDDSEKEAM